MKITKKKPLRPRGRSDEKRQSTKDAIRDVYANGPMHEVQIIPAKKIPSKKPKRRNFVSVLTAGSVPKRITKPAAMNYRCRITPK